MKMGTIILVIEIVIWLWIFAIPEIWIYMSMFYFFILFYSGIVIVKPNTVRSKEVFGKYTWVLRQWFNLVIPFVTSTIKQDLYRKNFPVEVEWVTQDNVTAYIGLNVIYYVNDEKDSTREGNIFKSIYNIDDPKTMMRSTIDEQLRAMMVTFTHKNIFAKREEIGEVIEGRLREKLSSFGFTLDSIQVRDVKLESTVMAAMNKIIETEKFKEAALNEAEANKIMQVKEAEAEMESKILLGQGMAGQRLKIAEWFKESIDMIKGADKSLNAKLILDFLLDSSRIETLWNIGKDGNSKLIYLNEDLEWNTSKARNEKLIAWSEIM